jgi:hypothetical protein
MYRRIKEQGRPVPSGDNTHTFNDDYIMPSGERIPAAKVRALWFTINAEWNGGRPSLPWTKLLKAAAERIGPTELRGRQLRQACTTALIAEIKASGLEVPGERTLRTHAKECQALLDPIAEITIPLAAE